MMISRHLLALSASAAMLTASLHAATPDEQAVLAPIQAMFDGMAKRDAAAIQEPLLPGGTLVFMRDGKPAQMTFEAFAERVGRPGTTHIEERIHDPLIRIDNDLAVVWAPFDFLVDGKIDHCGTDLFNLVRKTAAGSSPQSPIPAAKNARRNRRSLINRGMVA
jgi:Putative lumazine-binding